MSYDDLMAILPCIVLGLLCGAASYFQSFDKDAYDKDMKLKVKEPSIRRLLGNILSGAVISFVIFAILDSTDLTYMTKLAISSLVAFLGFDKALDKIERLLRLRGGG